MMYGMSGEYRLYDELAPWWPLISPPGEYEQDAERIAEVFGSASIPVRSVLDLGSGGGHIATHLKDRFQLTLVDISPEMLAVSREINPDCEHIQGDMHAIRLGRLFDAVLVHDAADYVSSEAGLLRVAQTAFAHCHTGGLAVFAPDHTAESFRPGTGGGGGSDALGRQASFRERTSDHDPADGWIEAEYEFVLRSASGHVDVIRETHRLSAFSCETWLRVLEAAGFDAQVASDLRPFFIGRLGVDVDA